MLKDNLNSTSYSIKITQLYTEASLPLGGSLERGHRQVLSATCLKGSEYVELMMMMMSGFAEMWKNY